MTDATIGCLGNAVNHAVMAGCLEATPPFTWNTTSPDSPRAAALPDGNSRARMAVAFEDSVLLLPPPCPESNLPFNAPDTANVAGNANTHNSTTIRR